MFDGDGDGFALIRDGDGDGFRFRTNTQRIIQKISAFSRVIGQTDLHEDGDGELHHQALR